MWRSHSTVELAQLAQHCRPAQQRPHYLQQTHSVRRVFYEGWKNKGEALFEFSAKTNLFFVALTAKD